MFVSTLLHADSIQNTDCDFGKSYGPSEITLSAVKVQIDYQNVPSSEENIPMGTPMPGYSIYILDSNMDPVATGVPGEIVIGGAGVSLGYLDNETLSAEKFLPNPWATPEYTKNGWTKMYRTGDRGRLTPDGHVLFHGRIEGDLQVKLRGIRIELEDIENSILQASKGAFTDVVCTVRGDPAFVVAHATFSPTFANDNDSRSQFIKELLTHLPLPSYMIPATIISLDNMPLTVHLKRDRAAIAGLPVSQSPTLQPQIEATDLTALELELKEIWVEVLPKEMGKGVAARDADFFRFGGSSLLMVELQSLVRRRFGVGLSLLELFRASKLAEMAKRIQELAGSA
jgi:hybrid polyketide synthase/nonribosomal peptide synthetase ACE1